MLKMHRFIAKRICVNKRLKWSLLIDGSQLRVPDHWYKRSAAPYQESRRGAHLPFLGHKPVGG